jgi:threonylcarbamoyladenosine tRNA methylthiotransferase MtaB
MDGPALAALGEPRRLFVVSGDLKSALLDLPRFLTETRRAGPDLPALLADWRGGAPRPSPEDRFRFTAEAFSFHSRPFLKIQDGCDGRCSYCRVALARGPAVSLGAEKALARLRALEEARYGEAVITGVNISQYRDRGLDLRALLEYLLGGTREICLRVSSIEPEGLSPELIQTLSHPRIRPHFHLSVQSGSPLILKKMGRSYTPGDVERAAALLRARKGDPFLACDIITGFPGETGEEFSETYELCRRVGFSWIHAFPYSPRPGTEAFRFAEPVCERDAVLRVETLLALGRRGRRDYISRWTGRTVGAIIQGAGKKRSDHTAALSDNNLRLMIPARKNEAVRPGQAALCRISSAVSGEGAFQAFDGMAEWA